MLAFLLFQLNIPRDQFIRRDEVCVCMSVSDFVDLYVYLYADVLHVIVNVTIYLFVSLYESLCVCVRI